MARLSQAQIAMYAQSAGMPNPVLMSAIAMAESGGSTTAHNPLGLDDSYGLWQVNMIGSMGPARRKEFGITSNTQLYDPAVNARAAAKILSSQGLSAWSTYTDGSYKKYMPDTTKTNATQANWWDDFKKGFGKGFDVGPGPEDLVDGGTSNDPGLQDVPGVAGVTDIAKGIGTIAEATAKTAIWLGNPKNWIRIAYVTGGAALIGMGLYIVASPVMSTPGAKALKKAVAT